MKRYVFFAMFLVICNFSFADEVRLKSGVVKSGQIVEKTDQGIVIKNENGLWSVPFTMIAEDQVETLKALPAKTAAPKLNIAVSGGVASNMVGQQQLPLKGEQQESKTVVPKEETWLT